jgi:hypothetical protein
MRRRVCVTEQMADEPASRAESVARKARDDAVERAGKLSSILKRTASALEHSAAIAEDHAERRRRSGDDEGCTKEHEAAARAADAARRARARADEADARHSAALAMRSTPEGAGSRTVA